MWEYTSKLSNDREGLLVSEISLLNRYGYNHLASRVGLSRSCGLIHLKSVCAKQAYLLVHSLTFCER